MASAQAKSTAPGPDGDWVSQVRDEIGRPDLEGYDNGVAGKRVTIVDTQVRYTNGMLGSDDEVVVREWEWWEKEPVRLVAIPQEDGTTSLQKLDDEQPDAEAFTRRPPDWGKHLEISCSS